MKTHWLALGLATVFGANLLAGETLNLKLVPERDSYVRDSSDEVVVKIDLAAVGERKKMHRTPLNLAVVLDRSGSMTGAKIERAKQAAMQLVDHLRPDDVFSLVIFSDEAKVVVPAQHVEDKDALKDKIEGVRAEGSTALYAGVETGAEQLDEFISSRRINRVILLSDGLANVGLSTPRDLRRLGSRLAGRGISVTTIGVGDDYNEDLMAGLAEASDANYYYVQDTEKLPEIFAKELGELQTVVVRDVRIEITCPEGVAPLGFIGRSEPFEDGKAVVKLSQFVPGQNRYLFLRCRVKGDQRDVAKVTVHYTDELDGGSAQATSGTARIGFTADQAVSDLSVNRAVYAEKELLLTAVAKDEAMAQADAGNYAAAGKILARQNATLNAAGAAAPAGMQSQIHTETQYLQNFSDQLEAGNYDGAARKTMQAQSYNTRNAK